MVARPGASRDRSGDPATLDAVTARTAWIVYSALRLGFFAASFAALMLLGWHWLAAAVVASLVAVSLSVIFLHRPRAAASESIYEWRTRERTSDDIAEDLALDGPGEARDDATGRSPR